MSETTYYKKQKEKTQKKTILNTATDYYKNSKEKLRLKARNKYRELSEEEKNIKSEYGRNRYHNMSEEKNETFKEYKKNYSWIKVKNLDF